MVDLWNLVDHPLAQKFYDLALELEKLPASEEQTDIMLMLAKLRFMTQDLLNKENPA